MAALPPPPAAVRRAWPWRGQPVAVYTLVALNVAVFLYQQTLSARAENRFVLNWALIPFRFFHPEQFAVPFVTSPPWLTAITSLFLHSGIAHIGLNMFFLFAIGRLVEPVLGTPRFLVIYALSGLASSLASIVVYRNEPVPVVGASGAIYGVFAAYLLLLPPGPNRTKTLIWMLAFIVVPAFIPPNVIASVTGSEMLARTAYWGHIGGFLIGGLVMQAFILRAKRRRALAAPMQAYTEPERIQESRGGGL